MAEAKKSLTEQFESLCAELAQIDYEEDFENYKKKADEMHKVAKQLNKEKVPLVIPRTRQNEDRYEFIGWSSTGYSIEKGKEVMVPRAVKDIHDRSEAQKQYTYNLIDQLVSDFEAESKK